jgi:hypothetical protein
MIPIITKIMPNLVRMPDRRAVFHELARYGASPTQAENIELAGK